MSRTALLLASVGMVSWGVWAVFADLATRSLEPEVAMVISYLAGIAIAVAYIGSQGLSPTLSGTGVGYALAGGLFSGVGAVSYYAALQYGTSGVVTTVTALYFVVAAVLGVVFLGESVGPRDVAAIALAVGAVALLSEVDSNLAFSSRSPPIAPTRAVPARGDEARRDSRTRPPAPRLSGGRTPRYRPSPARRRRRSRSAS